MHVIYMRIVLHVDYRLYDSELNKAIYLKEITSIYTAKSFDSLFAMTECVWSMNLPRAINSNY